MKNPMTIPDIEANGFVTVHPQANPHRGADPDDFDPRAVRKLLREMRGLSEAGMLDFHQPLWREVSQHGEYWWTPGKPRLLAVALYGVVGTGQTDGSAARVWIDAAIKRLENAEEGAL